MAVAGSQCTVMLLSIAAESCGVDGWAKEGRGRRRRSREVVSTEPSTKRVMRCYFGRAASWLKPTSIQHPCPEGTPTLPQQQVPQPRRRRRASASESAHSGIAASRHRSSAAAASSSLRRRERPVVAVRRRRRRRPRWAATIEPALLSGNSHAVRSLVRWPSARLGRWTLVAASRPLVVVGPQQRLRPLWLSGCLSVRLAAPGSPR
jgi:hypothetical protein